MYKLYRIGHVSDYLLVFEAEAANTIKRLLYLYALKKYLYFFFKIFVAVGFLSCCCFVVVGSVAVAVA